MTTVTGSRSGFSFALVSSLTALGAAIEVGGVGGDACKGCTRFLGKGGALRIEMTLDRVSVSVSRRGSHVHLCDFIHRKHAE